MRTKRQLTPIDIQAAYLEAQGLTEKEIYLTCGKTRGWLQTLKRRNDYQAEVERAKQEIKNKLTTESNNLLLIESLSSSDIELLLEKIYKDDFNTQCEIFTDVEKHKQLILNTQVVYNFLGDKYLEIASKMVDILLKKLERIEAKDVKINRVPSLLKAISNLSANTSETVNDFTGIKKLFELALVINQESDN